MHAHGAYVLLHACDDVLSHACECTFTCAYHHKQHDACLCVCARRLRVHQPCTHAQMRLPEHRAHWERLRPMCRSAAPKMRRATNLVPNLPPKHPPLSCFLALSSLSLSLARALSLGAVFLTHSLSLALAHAFSLNCARYQPVAGLAWCICVCARALVCCGVDNVVRVLLRDREDK